MPAFRAALFKSIEFDILKPTYHMKLILKKFDYLALIMILVTPVLLLETFGYWQGSYRIWPVFPLLVGCGFLVLFKRASKTDLIMVGIGTFIIGISLLFFYFNFTTWRNIVDLWPLFIMAAGAGCGASAYYARNRIVWYVSFGLFVLGAIFILTFSLSYQFWPISLALAGLAILVLNHTNNNYGTKKEKNNSR